MTVKMSLHLVAVGEIAHAVAAEIRQQHHTQASAVILRQVNSAVVHQFG